VPTTTSLLLSLTSELFELDSCGCTQIEALLAQINELILSKVQKFRSLAQKKGSGFWHNSKIE